MYLAWTGGKDSTLLLHLLNYSIPVIFLDSGKEFKEVYQFIDKIVDKYKLKIVRYPYYAPDAIEARYNKVEALKQVIKEWKVKCLFTAIRRDEHPSRSSEIVISPRKNHIRIHPLLDWTEDEVWKYIKDNKVPYCKLYDQGYRSLGEAPFTHKATSGERSGRDKDKESLMNELRELGYF